MKGHTFCFKLFLFNSYGATSIRGRRWKSPTPESCQPGPAHMKIDLSVIKDAFHFKEDECTQTFPLLSMLLGTWRSNWKCAPCDSLQINVAICPPQKTRTGPILGSSNYSFLLLMQGAMGNATMTEIHTIKMLKIITLCLLRLDISVPFRMESGWEALSLPSSWLFSCLLGSPPSKTCGLEMEFIHSSLQHLCAFSL